MSVKEFWEDDPDLFWAYRFSYYNKVKQEQEKLNNNAWLQGAYFYEALTIALANSFSKAKLKYSDKPYGFEKKEKTNDKQNEINNTVIELKGRIAQVQALWKNKQSSTAEGK